MPEHVISHAGRQLLDRRAFMQFAANGLGGIALATLLAERGVLAGPQPIRPTVDPARPYAPRVPHFAPRARRVLLVFCSGALSHLDTFDYKPELIRRHDTPPDGEKLVTFQGENGNLIKPLWPFKPRGECGKMVSDLLPNLAGLADDMCFVHSMTAKSNTHGPAENQMSTGFTLDGFPAIGCWVTYALGSECDDLPAFVAIPDPRGVPQVGPNHWNAAFLPAVFQGTAFNADKPIPNLSLPESIAEPAELATRDFLKFMNDRHLAKHPGDGELAARIASYEMAAKMQLAAPAVSGLAGESAATLHEYGVDDGNRIKAGFARNCLLARRLLERGVRFVQLVQRRLCDGRGRGELGWTQNAPRAVQRPRADSRPAAGGTA